MVQLLPRLLTLFALLLSIAACGAAPPAAPAGGQLAQPTAASSHAAQGRAIVLADVSNDPTKKIKRFQPLADYLAAGLAAQGIHGGQVTIAPNLEAVARMLKAGEVDIYFDSPYPAMIVSAQSGAQPILRRWKGGVADYTSLIFTRADGDIRSLTDLKGQTIGFEEDVSTSGYFLPLTHLIKQGLQPVEQATPEASVASNTVGYVFTGEDENTIEWVLSGKIAAGAIDSSSLAELPAEARQQLTVIGETERVPRQLVLVRPDLDPALLQALTTVLIDMEKSPEGQAVLQQFEETARFDQFPAEQNLMQMQQLYTLLDKP